jgi:transcriptional regulator with XRE-family HTH domain
MEGGTIQRLLGRLKALRVARGLTQEQFAEQSGISYKYYQAVEAGRKRDLRLSTLDRLAKAHGLETWQLLLPGGGVDSGEEKVKGRALRGVKSR